MAISNAIIHQLTSTIASKDINLRSDTFELTDEFKYLLGEVKSVFTGRSAKRYGCFSPETGHFKALTLNWLENKFDFTEYSHKVIEQLSLAFEEEGIETDGHWLIAEEKLESETRLWFFQIRHKSGLYLTGNLDLTESQLIDFGKLGFGACINLSQLMQEDGQKYLALSFGFGDKALQAMLLNFVNFVDTVDTTADTQQFMDVISAYAETMDNGSEYKKKAAEYCLEQDKVGETVIYSSLSDEVETEAEQNLVSFINQQSPELKNEFIPDRKSLKRYIRYSGKSKEVSISFSNETLGKNVKFDPATETLVISELPGSLLKQLKKQ